jgi:protein-S-isoprenylcysteine O-methyltransferase Ste14
MDASFQEWIKLWPYAVLMIVVASWIFYHFLAPASWREWAGAGLVQAFIIALYAEMYGFPLTIYFLTSALSVEIPLVHSSGHLWATLLGYGPVGAAIEMTIGSIFIVLGLLLIIKGWVKIYYSGDRLQTTGIYGIIRHPQYAGICLAIFGQLVHWPTILTLVLAPAIIFTYVRLARREEVHLLRQFGGAYRAYQREVPMFVPRWRVVRQAFAGR